MAALILFLNERSLAWWSATICVQAKVYLDLARVKLKRIPTVLVVYLCVLRMYAKLKLFVVVVDVCTSW